MAVTLAALAVEPKRFRAVDPDTMAWMTVISAERHDEEVQYWQEKFHEAWMRNRRLVRVAERRRKLVNELRVKVRKAMGYWRETKDSLWYLIWALVSIVALAAFAGGHGGK